MVDLSFLEFEIWHVAAACLSFCSRVIDASSPLPFPSLDQISVTLSYHALAVHGSHARIANGLALPDRTAVQSTSGYFFFEKFKSLPLLPGKSDPLRERQSKSSPIPAPMR